MVEFAIVIFIFLAIVIVGIDLLRLSYEAVSLQFVTNSVMREVVVGPSMRPPAYATQEQWIEQEIIRRAVGLGLDIVPANIKMCSFRDLVANIPCGSAGNNAGGAGEVISVEVRVPMSGIVWVGAGTLARRTFEMQSLSISKNEPWAG